MMLLNTCCLSRFGCRYKDSKTVAEMGPYCCGFEAAATVEACPKAKKFWEEGVMFLAHGGTTPNTTVAGTGANGRLS